MGFYVSFPGQRQGTQSFRCSGASGPPGPGTNLSHIFYAPQKWPSGALSGSARGRGEGTRTQKSPGSASEQPFVSYGGVFFRSFSVELQVCLAQVGCLGRHLIALPCRAGQRAKIYPYRYDMDGPTSPKFTIKRWFRPARAYLYRYMFDCPVGASVWKGYVVRN